MLAKKYIRFTKNAMFFEKKLSIKNKLKYFLI